jgi:hypothetical protein
MSEDETIAYYERLLKERGFDEALCWSVIEPINKPITIETVVERLGGDPGEIEEMSWAAAFEEFGSSYIAHLVQVGPAVAVVEFNGFQGHRRIEHLSEHARAHSAYWNVNALSSLDCAAFGHRLVSFEGLFPDQRTGLDICALDEELDPLHVSAHAVGRDEEHAGFPAVMMAIIERRTGVRFEEEWLDSDFPAIELPDEPNARPVDQGGFFFDPELEAALWLAPAQARLAFARELAELLMDVGELADEPEIPSVLEHLARDVPLGDSRYEPLTRLAERLGAEHENTPLTTPVRTNRPWRRAQAAWALRYTLMPPEHTPVPINGATQARLILGDEWLPARNRLRHPLRRPSR